MTKYNNLAVSLADVEWIGSFLCTFLAIIAGAMAAWCVGTDLGWAAEFPLHEGAMAHWHPWAIVAAMGEAGSLYLRNIARD